MNQPGATPLRYRRKLPHRFRIHEHRRCFIGLRSIYCRVRRGVDNDIRPNRLGGTSNRARIREIRITGIQCYDVTQRLQGALKFPTNLPRLSEDQELHCAY
jgi:hypothetical protein